MDEADIEQIATLGAGMAWVAGGLRIDMDAAYASRIRREALSPSTSNAVGHSCQARWGIERILPDTIDAFDPRELGSSCHAVLEELFSLDAGERTVEAIPAMIERVEARAGKDIVVPESSVAFDRWRAMLAERTAPLFDVIDPSVVEVTAIEKPVNGIEIAGVPVNGFVDLIALPWQVDWKFKNPAKKPWLYGPKSTKWADYHEQQRIYAMALRELGMMPERAQLVYVNHRLFDEVSLAPERLEATATAFAHAWSELNRIAGDRVLKTKPDNLCSYCPLVQVCPDAKPGSSPMVDAAKYGPMLQIAHRDIPRTVQAEDTMTSTQEIEMTNTNEAGSAPAPRYVENYAAQPQTPAGQFSVGGSTMNACAYGASGVMNYVAESRRMLAKQTSLVVTPNMVSSLAISLAYLVHRTQSNLTANQSYSINDGLNKLCRQALHTAIEMHPCPFGGDDEAWGQWQSACLREMEFLVRAGFWVFDNVFDPAAETAYTALSNAKRAEA